MKHNCGRHRSQIFVSLLYCIFFSFSLVLFVICNCAGYLAAVIFCWIAWHFQNQRKGSLFWSNWAKLHCIYNLIVNKPISMFCILYQDIIHNYRCPRTCYIYANKITSWDWEINELYRLLEICEEHAGKTILNHNVIHGRSAFACFDAFKGIHYLYVFQWWVAILLGGIQRWEVNATPVNTLFQERN